MSGRAGEVRNMLLCKVSTTYCKYKVCLEYINIALPFLLEVDHCDILKIASYMWAPLA